MRRLLLATAFVGCLWDAPSHAQAPVVDVANLVAQAKDYLVLVKQVALQGEQYVRQGQQLAYEIQQLESFVQNPSLGGAVGFMQMAGLGSALPINPYSVQGLISGHSGGLSGIPGALSSFSTGSFGSNSVYTCTDDSWACQHAREMATGNAGQQGIAMNSLQTMAAHLPVLQELRDNLASATTPAQRENATAALQSETAWGIQENNRLVATNILISSQRDVRDEQANEKLSKDLEATIARYEAVTQ